MEVDNYIISHHAMLRMAQRNIHLGDVKAVIRWGRELYQSGAKVFFLAARDLPKGLEKRLERIVGTAVVMSERNIITVYKNRRAIGKLKRRSKY